MPWTKEDNSFKTLIDRFTTSSTKSFYEESAGVSINVGIQDLWMDTLSTTPATAVSQGIAEARTLFTLTEDTSVGSQQCYYAFSGVRLTDWIPPKYGSDYTIHLYQNTNAEIFPADVSTWLFNYQTGTLVFNASTAAFSKPFKISGYRYIGAKGTAYSGTAPTPTGTGIKGQIYYDSTSYLYRCVATNTWIRSIVERTW